MTLELMNPLPMCQLVAICYQRFQFALEEGANAVNALGLRWEQWGLSLQRPRLGNGNGLPPTLLLRFPLPHFRALREAEACRVGEYRSEGRL